ncbi:crotonobetainyl-CoA:carnitine CoA-transferase CaiB-like acyl-CoA transferase [Novosphingobium chloroacetimidivorans]|uniref:Crotonobetainyl-CoA:carnitine CoA-transferase CaiB-like acyl-CoA transferase n=1 Tax=Novosphingobium chloroacetimidivorans TaxID=1428314 RepID=A0A7W7K8Y3_9SPHN|nr:CoA transferase [Novosphingobium chloroacetimidivorans]MBB4858432.1 crotonobetainyl-CoA:carnitine CoA-transferase CaiB-like acyl-CoA transferase [Novosphingobium chloroacetimidivorans]
MDAAAPSAGGPLAGVRVIDLTSVVFGPYATQIMADMGADVIKVEPPDGDNTRWITTGPEAGMGGIYVNVNRGKKSVMLDLRREEDKAALRVLIATADVFIHSMRGKAIARLGFDYEAVRAIRPDIVYTNCYGYSRRGPEADKPAYDDTIQAECGIPYVQGLMNGEPGYVATIMADKVAGLHALYATMMALFHRERTGGRGKGEGQEVEVTMFEAMASFMLVEHANGAMFSPPTTPAHYHRAVEKNRRPYRTKDGYVAALVYNDKHWNAFVQAVRPDWASDEFATLAQRATQIGRVYGLLGETFLTRTTQEWMDTLTALHIPCSPLRTTDELFDNAQLNAIGFFEVIETQQGPTRLPGVPTWFSRTPGRVQGPAPRLGADNDAVLGSPATDRLGDA